MLYNYFYNKNGRTFSWIFFIHVYNRVFETSLMLITQETVMVNKLHKKQWWSTNQIITLIIQTEYIMGGSHDCACMVVGFTTTYAFSAYHH